ncbi:MAG: hypothetical protein QOG83_29 [Alphaproteobacteria bacterium]|nr:hypothetical protein [Alphaproteobacteria bacterium]
MTHGAAGDQELRGSGAGDLAPVMPPGHTSPRSGHVACEVGCRVVLTVATRRRGRATEMINADGNRGEQGVASNTFAFSGHRLETAANSGMAPPAQRVRSSWLSLATRSKASFALLMRYW